MAAKRVRIYWRELGEPKPLYEVEQGEYFIIPNKRKKKVYRRLDKQDEVKNNQVRCLGDDKIPTRFSVFQNVKLCEQVELD